MSDKLEKFYQCQGDLANLPPEYKFWKPLDDYRKQWNFLPAALRDRIAEQCKACDYLMSLDVWLEPESTVGLSQKIMFIQSLASIYEGVLYHALRNLLAEEKAANPLFGEVMDPDRFGEKSMTFGITSKVSMVANIINKDWSDYLGYIRNIRNWIHLSTAQKGPLKTWAERQDYADLRLKLDEFRDYIKSRIKKL